MLFVWTFSTLIVYSHQVSNPNCLRANPGVLDAEFQFINRYENYWDFKQEDVTNHVALFSSRFKRAHEFYFTFNVAAERIAKGVSKYKKSWNRNFQLFLGSISSNLEIRRAQNATTVYKTAYKTAKKINSLAEGLVQGLYLDALLNTYKEQLEALESVFGLKENSTFPIGIYSLDCFKLFRVGTISNRKYLQRQDFINCMVYPTNKPSPEESAEEVIYFCDKLKDIAISINLTANITCSVGYPSFGTTRSGIQGSMLNFQKFWCKIVEKVTENQNHSQIIMESAFDRPPVPSKNNEYDLNEARCHQGWWRRRVMTSYEVNAFVEKVDELEGGTEHGNCTAECSYCIATEECCDGKFCFVDNSFQPFENGKPRLACQSADSTCSPRTPRNISSRSFRENNEISPSESGGQVITIVTLVVSAIILLVSIVVFLITRKSDSTKENIVLTELEISDFLSGSISSPRGPSTEDNLAHDVVQGLPYDKKLEIEDYNFEIYEDKLLGCGSFGVVVQGRLWNKVVAVKTTLPGISSVYLKSLMLELKALMYLGQHENIVNLLGANSTQLASGKLYLFLELCPSGNLLQYLRNHREEYAMQYECEDLERCPEEGDERRLTCRDLLSWSVQTASAMEYVAKKKVIHGDIAARNILVFSRGQVKLTDFGLSRRLYEHSEYIKNKQEPLPWRHLSLEALKDCSFSLKSDVWAFGVTLWEIFSLGETPYSGVSLTDNFVQLLTGGYRLNCPQHANPLLYDVMTSCWTDDIEARPPIENIHSKLQAVRNDL